MAAVPRDFHSPDAACAEVPARPYSSRHWRQRSTFSVTAVVARLLCLVRLRRDVHRRQRAHLLAIAAVLLAEEPDQIALFKLYSDQNVARCRD